MMFNVCDVSMEFFFRKFRLIDNEILILPFPSEVPEESPM